MTDLQTLTLALNDVARRARAERRYLDVGVIEGVIAYLDDSKTEAAETPPAEPRRPRGRPPKQSRDDEGAAAPTLNGVK